MELSNENVIVDTKIIGNTLLISLNSTHEIGIKNESGVIEEAFLSKELEELKKKYINFDNMTKVAILHHNIHTYGYNTEEEKAYNKEGSSGNVRNSAEVINILMKYGVKDIICGHEHASQAVEYSDWLSSDRHRSYIVGSLGFEGATHTITEFCLDDENGSIAKEILKLERLKNKKRAIANMQRRQRITYMML